MSGGLHSVATLLFLFLTSSILLSSHFSDAQNVPLVRGLSWDFYAKTCPKAESIIRNQIRKVLKNDIGQAAAILRIHFHDCFVQGCESSVLLKGVPGIPGEQAEIPNLTLRPAALKTIDDIGKRLQKECGPVVSCADILTIATRDALFLSGGPDYKVPLGRRDGLGFAPLGQTLVDLPSPFARTTELLDNFARQTLNLTDLVALSGGHSVGIGHCPTFAPRLRPVQDPTMDQTFARNLKLTCPTEFADNSTNLDLRSPNRFDNKYYVDLMNRQGLFTSDQDIYTDTRTRGLVTAFAVDQALFFDKFVVSMTKMGQLGVLTGNQGNIRTTCSVLNAPRSYISSVVGDEGETSVGF